MAARVLVVGGAEAATRTRALRQEGTDEFQWEYAPTIDARQGQAGHEPDAVVLECDAPEELAAVLDQVRRRHAGAAIVILGEVAAPAAAGAAPPHAGANAAGDGALTDGASGDGAGNGGDVDGWVPAAAATPAFIERAVRSSIRLRRLARDTASLHRALAAERARFNSIIHGNVDGIVVVDEAGTVVFANPAAGRLFGRDPDQLVGEPFGLPVVNGSETQLDLVRSDGDTALVEVRVIESSWETGPASMVMLRDVTHQKAQEERERELLREQAARQAAEAAQARLQRLATESASLAEANRALYEEALAGNRAKTDFLAVMSHELRTPLNAVFGFADLLETGVAGPLTEQQTEYTGRIQQSARHLLSLVDEILDYAKLEAGRADLRLRDADFREVLEEAASLVEPSMTRKGLDFPVELPPSGVTWHTDPAKVRQVLFNLLSNAAKFTQQGEVGLAGRASDDEVVIVVHDTGIGIDPADHSAVFDPFWQVAAATTREQGGTGLGLAIARRLTELLGGTISLDSDVGAGARFTIRFPRQPQLSD
ncbi:MAG TPA: ATP-binding protein [Longimicrobiales bacterium]|nr:ATP-binding protein [Longimicrobiales bacterium]